MKVANSAFVVNVVVFVAFLAVFNPVTVGYAVAVGSGNSDAAFVRVISHWHQNLSLH